jgi:hypothetical protein
MATTSDTHPETDAIRSTRERNEARAIDESPGLGRSSEAGLRFAVSAVERQVSLLAAQLTTAEDASTVESLMAKWAELVDRLALGPQPEVRSCPACGRLGMSAASLCGFCWSPLSPAARAAVTSATASYDGPSARD